MKNSTTLNKAALPAENSAAIKSILLSCMVAGAVFSARAQDQRIASPDGKLVDGRAFPALFKTQDTWLLVSEGSLSRGFCGSRLRHELPDGEYSIGYPDSREGMNGEPVNPVSTRPWITPERFIVIGDLKTIAESTVGTDLAEPAKFDPAALGIF